MEQIAYNNRHTRKAYTRGTVLLINRLHRIKRIARILAGFVMALAIVYAVWSVWANLPPDVSIPPQKLPKPNGYDYYVQAENQINSAESEKLRRVFYPPEPANQRYPTIVPQLRPANHSDKEALLREVQTALDIARDGLKYQCVVPRLLKVDLSFTKLSKAFLLESAVSGENGDWQGSMNSLLDLLQLQAQLSLMQFWNPPYHDETYRRFWKILPHLNRTETRQALVKAKRILGKSPSFAEKMRAENILTELQLLDWLKRKDWRTILASSYDCLCEETYTHNRERMICRFSSKRRIMREWITTSNQINRNAKLPYRLMPRNYPPKHEFFHLYFEAIGDMRVSWESDSIRNNLILLGLALRIYHYEHHAYPTSLSQLVPEYLSKLPDDPFAEKGTFRYFKEGTSYLLYSLGPNCKDDGGKLLPTKNSNYCAIYKDIVANPRELVLRYHPVRVETYPLKNQMYPPGLSPR